MRGRCLSLLALGVCACTSPASSGPDMTVDPCTPVVLVPAADATDAERASIEAAVRLWNDTAGAWLTLDEVDAAPRVEVSFRSAPLAFLGIYEHGGVIINRDLTDGAVRTIVVAHEVGHAFGLVHVKTAGSVMVAGNVTTPPGAPDVAALAAHWGACK